jgi:predicted GIY-YIG superfamily endonuclease
MTSIYVVYVLQSDNCSYVGMTNDFLRRFRQHNKEIKGGAKCTSRRDDWYPICIIDGFLTMVEALQCEWSLKHYLKKKFKGPKGRIQRLSALLDRGIWTSKSPSLKDQDLTIYIDDEYKEFLKNNIFQTKELYWKH